jgi:hypothetical protein
MDLCLEHESFGVYEQMPLTAFDLLTSVVAALFCAHSGTLDRLAIDNACTGLRVSFQANSQTFSDSLVDLSPSAIDAPLSEVVIDGRPSLGKSWGSIRHYWQPLFRT